MYLNPEKYVYIYIYDKTTYIKLYVIKITNITNIYDITT